MIIVDFTCDTFFADVVDCLGNIVVVNGCGVLELLKVMLGNRRTWCISDVGGCVLGVGQINNSPQRNRCVGVLDQELSAVEVLP